ncbi:DUF1236 domain-containing protein [Enterovirga aerilata]|uniref:DUF1236 domain-containing protein n=1 Tax=Enterovirga aerilata TaxID=2730920 RepID=A0A849I5T7_9HYPH|nr:DUF1236 domain-containing protein [Enterovirga sp. DB1703]NNM73054.1 DUF1236 domain-containing protein [Enterovirga sp. DB1703]
MKTTLLMAASLAAALSTGALAQGTIPGAAHGAAQGADTGAAVGGPVGGVVGGVVGGAVGAATGTVGGILGVDTRPRFRTYVESRNVPSYRYREEVRVGTVLPAEGVTYYEVPAEYGVREYRYTVVNDRTVLVEPRTRRIVEVIE